MAPRTHDICVLAVKPGSYMKMQYMGESMSRQAVKRYLTSHAAHVSASFSFSSHRRLQMRQDLAHFPYGRVGRLRVQRIALVREERVDCLHMPGLFVDEVELLSNLEYRRRKQHTGFG